jgi:hypothetical protein
MFQSPCSGCSKSERCRADRLACAALVLFRHSPSAATTERLAAAPRQPSRELYGRAMAPVRIPTAPKRRQVAAFVDDYEE